MAIYQNKKNKTWYVNTSWREDGKRHYKTIRGLRTKREAQQAEIEFKAKLQDGFNMTDDPVFADYFDKWVEVYKGTKGGKNNNVSDANLDNYLLDGRRIRQGLGKIKLKKMNRSIYQKFLNQFGETHAKTTVTKLHKAVKACARSALKDGLINRNFTDDITVNFNPDKSMNVTYLQDDQIKQLIHYLITHRNPSFSGSYMILAAIYTGLRESELAGLQWNDIDTKNNEIHIRRAWKYKEKDYGPTKNKTSTRTISCSPQMIKMLEELKSNDKVRVFWSPARQGFPNSHTLNAALRSALKELNIDAPGFHFHSLRHSQVAILIDADISTYDIAQRLGHSSTRMVEDVYAYEFEKHRKKVSQKINSVLDNWQENDGKN